VTQLIVQNWIDSWNHKWLIGEQDLQLIRDHFGEKLAFYFAFLQNYFLWLSVPAVMGVIVHFTLKNTFNIIYGILMMLWSIIYLEVWKRKERNLAVKWGVRNYSKHDKQHAGFTGEKMVIDEITGEQTPYCPPWKLFVRRAVTVPGVAIAAAGLSLVVGFVFAVEVFLHEYYNGPFHKFLVSDFHITIYSPKQAPNLSWLFNLPSTTHQRSDMCYSFLRCQDFTPNGSRL
jgi:hypothetical protein